MTNDAYKAQQKAEHEAQNAQHKVDLEAVVLELKKLGYDAKLTTVEPVWGDLILKIEVDGYTICLNYNYQNIGTVWSRRRGIPYMTVGDYNRKVFKQKKGVFNYAAIAEHVMNDATMRKTREDEWDRVRNATDTNKPISEKFNKRNKNDYRTNFAVDPSSDLSKPLSVGFEIKRDMTVDEAQAIWDLLKANNFLGE